MQFFIKQKERILSVYYLRIEKRLEDSSRGYYVMMTSND